VFCGFAIARHGRVCQARSLRLLRGRAGAKLARLLVFAALYGAVAGGVYSLAGGLLGEAGTLFWPYSLIALFGYAVPVSILLGVSGGVAFYVCRLKD
jgi:hypothetical protein